MRYYTILIAGILGIVMMAVVAQGAEQTVTLTWDANTETDLVGYNLYQSESADGPWDKINVAGVITGVEYAITYSAPTETIKYYYLTATDGRNESGPSNIVSTLVDTIAPSPPGLLRLVVEGSVSLTVNGPVTIKGM